MGNDHENCSSITHPCQTIQHAFDKVALSNDVIKIDGSFGNFTIKKQIRISKPVTITFTSYNGVPWIYGEGTSWRNFKSNQILALDNFESSTRSMVTINSINFRDTALARIGRHKALSKNKIQFKIINCRFQFSNTESKKNYKIGPWLKQAIVSIFQPFTEITFENCVIKAKYQTGIIRYPKGKGCKYLSSTRIKFRNTRIEDARYSLLARSPECKTSQKDKALELIVEDSILKSNDKYQSREAQFTVDVNELQKYRTRISIEMKNSSFEDLLVRSRTAAVMDIRGISFVKIKSCTFKRNIGYRGGALSLQYCSLYLHDSYFEGNKARVSTVCSYKDQGGSGGAIFVGGKYGPMTMGITDSTFTDNHADCFGSAIYFGYSNTLTVKRTRFSTIFVRRNVTGPLWFSASRSLALYDVSFEARESGMEDGELFFASSKWLRLGAKTPYFKCPKGSALNVSRKIKVRSKWSERKVSCQYCPKHSYTLRPSYAIGLNETKSKQAQQQKQCHQCSFGATCKRGIKPKPNFWGYVNKGKVFMLVCPPDYCCQTKDKCVALQSCNGMRTGRLCGKCKNGYFQSFFTSECLHEKFCKTGKFWALAVCFCVLFTILFIFLQDIFLIILNCLSLEKVLPVSKRIIDWVMDLFSRKMKGNEQEKRSETDEDSLINESIHDAEESVDESIEEQANDRKTDFDKNSMAGGLIKIVFFFYQIHSILTPYNSDRKIQYLTKINGFILSVFNLNIQVPGVNEIHCPLHRMDSTTKVLIKALSPINYIIFATFLYILVHALALCFKSNEMIQMYSMKAKPRLLTAILQLILLGYSILISNTLSLVTCLPLVTGQKILYIDGSVSCYQHWQYAILTFIIVWAIPLIYALHKLPIYMRNGEISIRGFYIALLLPLPFVVYAIIRGAREIQCVKGSGNPSDTLASSFVPNDTTQRTDVTMLQLLNVIEGPFRHKESGDRRRKLPWEPVILLQRLLLSLCYTFVLEPINRSLVLPVFVVVFAMLNCLYRPFNSVILNAINGVMFILLCITGLINVIRTISYEHGGVPEGPIVKMLALFDNFEIVMLLIFPLAIVLTFVVLAVKLIAFVCRIVADSRCCVSSDN